MKETLCWKCATPGTGGCSWDRCFAPVECWTAAKTTVKMGKHKPAVGSFAVHSCPLFRPETNKTRVKEKFGGIRKITDEQLLTCVAAGLNDKTIAAMFGMAPESVYRRRRNLGKARKEEEKK